LQEFVGFVVISFDSKNEIIERNKSYHRVSSAEDVAASTSEFLDLSSEPSA
jgi:hypothetical protein